MYFVYLEIIDMVSGVSKILSRVFTKSSVRPFTLVQFFKYSSIS